MSGSWRSSRNIRENIQSELMSEIKAFPYNEEPKDVKSKVVGYWSKRSGTFSDARHGELHSHKGDAWKAELLSKLPQKKALKILDVGCGTGFFEMLLSPEGFQMTGIDLTPEMIEEGKALIQRHGAANAKLLVMDAEHPDFPDETFDCVISRNLTWTLPHPADAYKEWYRVLKTGGVLLNYDAEYAKGFHSFDQTENLAHKNLDKEQIEECHDIYHMLSISAFDRPEWDIRILLQTGFREIAVDPSVGDRLYAEKDEFYIPDRMFCVRAVK